MNNAPPGVTRLLREVSEGNREALDELVPLVYRELRRRARDRLQHDRHGHTFQDTVLVQEGYLRGDRRTVNEWLAYELYQTE